MTLIVEDGTGVADANTYLSLDDIKAWAEARGVDTTSFTEPMVIKAMDFIERMRDKYAGSTSTANQRLAFPRYNIWYEGDYISPTLIHQRLKDALSQLVVYVSQGIELEPISKGGETKFLVRQKLGPIEREYSEAAFLASNLTPAFYTVSSLLAPFMKRGSGQLAVSRA